MIIANGGEAKRKAMTSLGKYKAICVCVCVCVCIKEIHNIDSKESSRSGLRITHLNAVRVRQISKWTQQARSLAYTA